VANSLKTASKITSKIPINAMNAMVGLIMTINMKNITAHGMSNKAISAFPLRKPRIVLMSRKIWDPDAPGFVIVMAIARLISSSDIVFSSHSPIFCIVRLRHPSRAIIVIVAKNVMTVSKIRVSTLPLVTTLSKICIVYIGMNITRMLIAQLKKNTNQKIFLHDTIDLYRSVSVNFDLSN